jgi:hypothetical protein
MKYTYPSCQGTLISPTLSGVDLHTPDKTIPLEKLEKWEYKGRNNARSEG